jgi:tetratricopeptide (TPR) repeat protein
MAIQHYARAMRLSPLDPYLYTTESGTALAHFHAGRYELASDWAKKALRGNPYFPIAMNVLAASLALAGRMEEAQKATARVRRLLPELRISNLRDIATYRRPEDMASLVEG